RIMDAKSSGDGSGWRPGPSNAGRARSRSRSNDTAPGRCPPSKASCAVPPGIHRTSASTNAASGCARSQDRVTAMSGNDGTRLPLVAERGDQGSMVARLAFARRGLAFVAIDLDADQAVSKRRRAKQQVDPKTPPSMERSRAVVPVGERTGGVPRGFASQVG